MPGYRSVWAEGRKVAEFNGDTLVYADPEYFSRKRSELAAPMIMRDIGEYTSPIDGERITSRSAHRDHLRQHDVIEVGNERVGTQVPEIDTSTLGHDIKRCIEEVKAMPQREYDAQVAAQRNEHEAIGALAVAS